MRIKLKPGVTFACGHLLQNVHHDTWYEVFNPRSPYRYIRVDGRNIYMTKTAIRNYFNVEKS